MKDRFKMTNVVGIENTAVSHNNCGEEDVGVVTRFPDFAQRAIDIGGNVNRVIVKRINSYLTQKFVEHRFFFGAGLVAEPLKDFIDGDGGYGSLLTLLYVCRYSVNHHFIVGKEVG
jgi:hypothetical protein